MSTEDKKDNRKFLILISIAYVVLLGFMIYRAQQSPGSCPFLAMCGNSTTAKTVKAEPDNVIKKKEVKLPTLLELGSKHCVPCQMMEPILEKLKKEYSGVLNVKFIDLNLKENIDIGKKYKINSIPVQIFLDADGKELWRHTGYFPAENIVAQWKKLGYDLQPLKKVEK